MFKFLKNSWQEAKRQVEEEDRARAAAVHSSTGSDDPAATMQKLAQEYVAQLAGKGLPIDLTPASLPLVDGLLVAAKTDLATMPEQERRQPENIAALKFGACLGEVLRRAEGGAWTKDDKGVPAIDLGALIAPVGTVAFGLLTQGAVQMPTGPVRSLTEYYKLVSDLVQEALDAAVRGSHPTMEGLYSEMSDRPELAKMLVARTQTALRTAQIKWGVALDLTPASLDAVERILAELHDLLKGATPDERPSDQQIEKTAFMWGAYLGEVVRRHYGGKWSVKMPDDVLQLEIGTATVFPQIKVFKRITQGPADAIPFYFKAMGAHVNKQG